MKQTISASIITLLSTLLWVGLVGAIVFLASPMAKNYITIQNQIARKEAILGCAQASRSIYTEKSDNWERTTDEPNREFYTTCLNTVLGE